MKFSELSREVQEELLESRPRFRKEWECNSSYHVCLINDNCTRYFKATRSQSAFRNNKGNYMPFGGGSQWTIEYGPICFRRYSNPFGGMEYEWKMLGRGYAKSSNGTVIPRTVSTKKEVMAIAKSIGLFNL